MATMLAYLFLMQNDGELTKCNNIHPKTTNLRNLAHRRPEQRPKTVSSNVQRQSQCCGNLSDAKICHYIHETGCVNG